MNFFQGWWSTVTSFASPVLGLVRAAWLRTLVYASAIALAIWFYGSYIRIGTFSPLDSDRNRLYAVAACYIGWLLFLLWWLIIGRRRNAQLIGGLTGGGIEPRLRHRGRGGADAAASAAIAPAAAAADGRPARLPVRAALVRHHRPPRLRQDHRAQEQRAQVPAGRQQRARADARRGRHPQLRLVDHRAGDPAGHRRPLHHAGQRPRGRPRRLAGLPEAAQAISPAAADQRRDRGAEHRGDRRCRQRRAAGARAGDPLAHLRVEPGLQRALPALRRVHQGRPGGRLRGVLRRAEPGRPRAGLGHDLPRG